MSSRPLPNSRFYLRTSLIGSLNLNFRFPSKLLLTCLLTAILILTAVSGVAAEESRYIIGFQGDEEVSELSIQSRTNGSSDIVKINEKLGFIVVNTSPENITDTYAGYNISYFEPDQTLSVDYVPTDPYSDKQWALSSIKADKAWDLIRGDGNILVAVIDTGIDYNHPDLKNVYLPYGHDFVNNDNDPMDDHGHGTLCSGVIGAEMNNGKGISGTAKVKLMAEKVLNKNGNGYISDLVDAILHATDAEAKIISMSLGSVSPSTTLNNACQYAWEHDVLLVAASGNGNSNSVLYPAAYPSVIAVGSVNQKDSLSDFSNYGSEQELVAPGENIYTTYLDNTYVYSKGTSISTAYVSGVGALAWYKNPSYSNTDIRNTLQYTAHDLGSPNRDNYYGFGKVNAFKAVSASLPSKTIYVPYDYGTIQKAVNVANQNDEIIVGDGVYTENVKTNKGLNNLTIRSENGTDECTIISGSSSHIFNISADNVSISGFTIKGAEEKFAGIHILNSSNVEINNNKFADNYYGILINKSFYSSLSDNTLVHNEYGLHIDGSTNKHFIHEIGKSNKINGKPVYYIHNPSDEVYSQEAGFLGIINGINVTVEDIVLRNSGQGVLFVNTSNSSIENVTISGCYHGIYIHNSTNNKLTKNNIQYNAYGISLYSSNKNSIFFNNIMNNTANNVYSNSFSDMNSTPLNSTPLNMWHSNEPYIYQYRDSEYISHLGNYWIDYNGSDLNENGIGDSHYTLSSGEDLYPLIRPIDSYSVKDNYSLHEYVQSHCGDTNCDGKVNLRDVISLWNHYREPSYLCRCWAGDVNNDGSINLGDIIKLFNHVKQPKDYGLTCYFE